MSQYTTGEMARQCGVTVRTVQYYDARGILTPSALSEGGRRLYSEDDLRKLGIICFLRELGLSIDSIGQLLSEEDPASVIDLLLDQQEQVLREEIDERQGQLEKLSDLRRALKREEKPTVESIGDIAFTMEGKKKLRGVRRNLILAGLPLSVLQWAGIALWILRGQWWLFAVWAVVAIPCGVLIIRYYHRRVAYLCPQCHKVFQPKMKQFFFASHTPSTRRLTCTHCGHHGFCVEVYNGD